ncbi:alcohol dehydrogenase catalytic domain-containing protein [Actinomadura madurae]|uniref:alcohol dehydrogenase catalytic domain-containing protein n=1 Tax=Actinomadura madurae TaxID=1993 RepID=UPI0020D223A6|nr:alcohol dehydrogenase catalytic domain-containing protein [Actinomadura madurae]MCQ0020723.1 alcohol dehydrogenase catalytic domain-containing protein [Actinomadura madurae]
MIAGHEPSGRIVAAGPGVRRFGAGDRVIVYHIVGCGLCDSCRRGHYISCGFGRESYGWQRDGGHAPYLLAEERTCVPLPDELSYVDGALIACGFGTAYEGLRRAGVSGDTDLLVVGLGPVGLAAGMVGRGMGARKVIGVEPSEARRTWAGALGVFDATLPSDDGAAQAVADLTGRGGAAVTIDCSGTRPGRSLALEAAAEWGARVAGGRGRRPAHRGLRHSAAQAAHDPRVLGDVAAGDERAGAQPRRLGAAAGEGRQRRLPAVTGR